MITRTLQTLLVASLATVVATAVWTTLSAIGLAAYAAYFDRSFDWIVDRTAATGIFWSVSCGAAFLFDALRSISTYCQQNKGEPCTSEEAALSA